MFENESMEITKKLLIAMGFEIKKDNNSLIEQDTHNQIFFDGKLVKANTNPDKALYIDSDYDIRLDPLDPKCTKLMERMFGKFLDDAEEMENLPHALTYYFDLDKEEKKNRLSIKFEGGDNWIGNWYYNKIISYNEAILMLDGTFEDVDLKPYDIQYDAET